MMQASSNGAIAPLFSSRARPSERIDEALERAPLAAFPRELSRLHKGKYSSYALRLFRSATLLGAGETNRISPLLKRPWQESEGMISTPPNILT
jgi:hypothetical protein